MPQWSLQRRTQQGITEARTVDQQLLYFSLRRLESCLRTEGLVVAPMIPAVRIDDQLQTGCECREGGKCSPQQIETIGVFVIELALNLLKVQSRLSYLYHDLSPI